MVPQSAQLFRSPEQTFRDPVPFSMRSVECARVCQDHLPSTNLLGSKDVWDRSSSSSYRTPALAYNAIQIEMTSHASFQMMGGLKLKIPSHPSVSTTQRITHTSGLTSRAIFRCFIHLAEDGNPKHNTSSVATVDKLPRSLRSVSPAPPCQHI